MSKFTGRAASMAAIVSFVVACNKIPTNATWGEPPAGAPSCDLPLSKILDTCHPPSCGGNSPLVNAFPINGLHPDGCKNGDGDKLDQKLDLIDLTDSHPCKKKANGASLYLDYAPVDPQAPELGYELVARQKRQGPVPLVATEDTIVCRREELVGVRFRVIVKISPTDPNMPTPPKKPTDYRIGHVARIDALAFGNHRSSCRPSEALCSPPPTAINEVPVGAVKQPRVAYLITPVAGSQSVCMTPPPEEVDTTKYAVIVHSPGSAHDPAAPNKPPLENLTEVLAEDLPLYSIIIPGAVYDFGAELIPKSLKLNDTESSSGLRSSHRWFNIACSKDALAQTELLAMTTKRCQAPIDSVNSSPASEMDDDKSQGEIASRRAAPLHMLTAKYVDGRSATTRGTPVAWCWGRKSEDSKLTTEATWGDKGARCVSHSRLWRRDKIVYVPAQIRSLFDAPWDKPMCEKRFLKRVCGELRSLSSDADCSSSPADNISDVRKRSNKESRTSAGNGIVRPDCEPAPDELISFVRDHSGEDNQMIMTF